MKKIAFIVVFFCWFSLGCVGPPDYSDGLLENIPAVINENDYFSLSLLGDKYTYSEEWDLTINANSIETLLTTLVVKDLNILASDSTFLFLINEFEDTVMNVPIFDEIVFSSSDSIIHIGTPSRVIFSGKNFTGRLEFQILINQ